MSEETKKELEWGQTPWDNLSREEMLRTIQRMYTVIVELNSLALDMLFRDRYMAGIPTDSEQLPSVFWDKPGRGGATMERARQVLEPLQNEYGSSEIYRAFFRYADDLLFEKNGFDMIGDDWVVCPDCGVMWGDRQGTLLGKPCGSMPMGKKGCNGTFRKLIWDDLKPGRWAENDG